MNRLPKNRPSYNPNGVCKSPIAIRLMTSEKFFLDTMAKKRGVSRAKVIREALLIGIHHLKNGDGPVVPPSSPEA